MLMADDCLEESQLKKESRNAISVLRVQNKLSTDPHGVIFGEVLQSKGQHDRYVELTQK